jgi:hypothetical protein
MKNADLCSGSVVSEAFKECKSVSGKTPCEEFYWWLHGGNGAKCRSLADVDDGAAVNPCTDEGSNWKRAQASKIAKVRQQGQSAMDIMTNYANAERMEFVLLRLGPDAEDSTTEESLRQISNRSITVAEIKELIGQFGKELANSRDQP